MNPYSQLLTPPPPPPPPDRGWRCCGSGLITPGATLVRLGSCYLPADRPVLLAFRCSPVEGLTGCGGGQLVARSAAGVCRVLSLVDPGAVSRLFPVAPIPGPAAPVELWWEVRNLGQMIAARVGVPWHLIAWCSLG